MLDWHIDRLLGVVTGTSPSHGPPWTLSSPCPDSILVRVGAHYTADHCVLWPQSAYCRFPNLTTAHEALVKCPAVHTLDVSLDPSGCNGREWDYSSFPFDMLQEGQRYPALKSLRLDGYSFGSRWFQEQTEDEKEIYGSTPFSTGYMSQQYDWVDGFSDECDYEALRVRNTVKQQTNEHGTLEQKTNLLRWLDVMDWSQLEELSIVNKRSEMDHVTAKLPQRLTALKTLHINSLPFVKNLQNHTLVKLVWIGSTSPGQLDTILAHQKNLKSLEYRCDEPTCSGWSLHTNITLLSILGSKLEHIAINLPRLKLPSEPLVWPFEHLKSIASIHSLRTADLYFRMRSECSVFREYLASCRECGPAGTAFEDLSWSTEYCLFRDQFETPLLNQTTALKMFSYLRSHKVGKTLEKVNFKTGDWNAPWDGRMRMPSVVDGLRSLVVCNVDNGQEVCKRIEHERYEWGEKNYEWRWNGESFIFDTDFDRYDDAIDMLTVEEIGQIKERIRKRLRQAGIQIQTPV